MLKSFLVCILIIGVVAFQLQAQIIQTSGAGSGNWNDPLSWSPNTVPTAVNSTSILINHPITVAATAGGDQMVVNSGGSIVIGSGITFTVAAGTGDDLTINSGGSVTIQSSATLGIQNTAVPPPPKVALIRVYGTINNAGSISNASSTTLIFEAGSTYDHQYTTTAGAIPVASWNTTSTCSITGYTTNSTAPSGLNQSFGNFVWDTPSLTGFVDLNGALTTVKGNLTISNVPSSYVYLSSVTGYALSVGGNLTIDNSYFGLNSTAISSILVTGNALFSNNLDLNPTFDGDLTLTVGGDLEFSGGSTNLTYGGAGSIPISVGGNFILSSSPVINNGGTGTYTLTFNGAGPQSYQASQDFTDYSYVIQNGSTVNVPSGSFFGGAGAFTLQAGATLGVGTANGITTGTSQGTVRVSGLRSYIAGGNIVYNGSVAQNLGNEWGSSGALNGVAVNLEINNPSGVTNNIIGSTSLVGNLTLTAGSFNIGNSNTLQIQSNFSGNGGTIGGLSTSNLTFAGSGSISGTLDFTSGSQSLNNFTINRAGTILLGTNLTISGTLSFSSSGNLNFDQFDGQTLTIAGDIVQSGAGALISGTNHPSNLTIGGIGALTDLPFSGTNQLYDVVLSRTTGGTYTWADAVTITNSVSLTSGTLTNTGITMGSGSTFNRSAGTSVANTPSVVTSYNVNYNGNLTTGPELPSGTTALNDLTVAGTVVLNKDITINGTLTLSGGGFNAGSRLIDFKGDFVSNAGSTLTSAGITFSGTTTLTGSVIPTFGAITIAGTFTPMYDFNVNGNLVNNGTLNAGSSQVTFGGTTTISGSSTHNFNNVAITGTLTAPANMNVSGNWNNTGTFVRGASSNTVTFNGTTSFVGLGTTQFSGININGTLNSSTTLTLNGNFTNNGTFNANSGTVVFAGSTAQAIGGSSGTLFSNISVTKPTGTLSFSTAAQLSGVLSMTGAGNIHTNGNLTLLSSASGDARIAQITGGPIFGNVIVQRYLPNSTSVKAYRYLSSPVGGAFVSDWKAEFPITGTFNDPSTQAQWPGIPGINQSSPSLYLYNEAHTPTSTIDDRYESYPYNGTNSGTSPITNGQGYAAWVRQTAPITLDVTGVVVQGATPVNVTAQSGGGNDGWNLIGNPYPSPINWDNVTIPAGVDAQIALKDNTDNIGLGAGQYIYFTQGSPGTGIPLSYTGTISMGQAFWVHATSNATITFQEDDKEATSTPPFVRSGSLDDILRIHISGNGHQDEMVVHFDDNATDDADQTRDALKLKNDYINLSSLSTDGKKLAINTMAGLNCNKQIDLTLENVTPGHHVLTFSQYETFSPNIQISLVDSFTGTTYVINNLSNSYDFEVTSDAGSFGSGRFKLFFAYPSINTDLSITTNDICQGSNAIVTVPDSQAGINYYATIAGSPVSTEEIGNGGDIHINIPDSNLSVGSNEVVVMAYSTACDLTPLTNSVTVNLDDLFEITGTSSDTVCQSGPVTLSATGAPADGSYHWYDVAVGGSPIPNIDGASFITPTLSKTETYYVAAVNSSGCEGPRMAIPAVIVSYDEAVLTIDESTGALQSNYPEHNQWYKDGEAIAGATGQTYLPEETGYYEFKVTIGKCETSAGREFTVTGLEDSMFFDGRVTYYPNPVNNMLTLEIADSGILNPRILDITGRIIGTVEMKTIGDKMVGTFDFSERPQGLYLLQVCNDKGSFFVKRITKY